MGYDHGSILPESEFGLLLYIKGKGVWLIVANFLMLESFVLAVNHIGHNLPVNFQQNKRYSLLCNFLPLNEWILKGRSLKNGLSCIFQAIDILLGKVQSQHD